jgi:hypothetical protein
VISSHFLAFALVAAFAWQSASIAAPVTASQKPIKVVSSPTSTRAIDDACEAVFELSNKDPVSAANVVLKNMAVKRTPACVNVMGHIASVNGRPELAVPFFAEAMQGGFAPAFFNVSQMYFTGQYFDINPEKAFKYLEAGLLLAIRSKNLYVENYIRSEFIKYCYSDVSLPVGRKTHFLTKANQYSRSPICTNALGVAIESEDYQSALSHYVSASNRGSCYASRNLALIYFHGNGGPKNLILSKDFAQKAKRQSIKIESCEEVPKLMDEIIDSINNPKTYVNRESYVESSESIMRRKEFQNEIADYAHQQWEQRYEAQRASSPY